MRCRQEHRLGRQNGCNLERTLCETSYAMWHADRQTDRQTEKGRQSLETRSIYIIVLEYLLRSVISETLEQHKETLWSLLTSFQAPFTYILLVVVATSVRLE